MLIFSTIYSTHWFQTTIELSQKSRGCHLVTKEVLSKISPELSKFKVGLATFFLQHTSAGLSINENADPTVRADMSMTLDHIIPETLPYKHDDEGPDDMPAHVKSTLVGVSLTVPISNGDLAFGTWQGIWLNEFRNHGGKRRIVVTLFGQGK